MAPLDGVWRNIMRAFAVLAMLPVAALAAPPPQSSILEVASTGRVLEARDPDALRHPASLTKLMTLYMTFQALRDHRIAMEELVPVSPHAAAQQPTKLGLVPGMRITVRQAILGLITRSANDAAVALAELLGGSEPRFAQMMTLEAHALGMRRTHFVNASGLPAGDQWTTARDMALLARRLIADFPQYYPLFSTPSFVFHGQTVVNLDGMLKLYPGVDGLKTGFVDASGRNLVTSAVRDGVRLVGVEFGATSWPQAYGGMGQLLNAGYLALNVPLGGPRVMTAQATPGLGGLIAHAHAATLPRPPAALPRPPVRAAAFHPPVVHPSLRQAAYRRPAPAASWGIQVGAFRSLPVARSVAYSAQRLTGGGGVRLQRVAIRGGFVWRAQVTGLSQHAAYGACGQMAHDRRPCMVFRLLPGQRYARG
ncbi:MAG: D-alanyl-D-alanine carboxypeptidase family protein [Acetobacteraceae bacterium]